MPGIAIPEQFLPGFQVLNALSDDTMGHLLSVISTEEATLLPRQWIRRVSSHFRELERDDIEAVIESALSLFSVRSYLSMTTRQFAEAITSSDDLDIPKERQPLYAKRLEDLLDAEPLFITSKALAITTEDSHSFHDARIITEIRPIFYDDAKRRPAAVSIVHHLKISYHEGADMRDFYVLLTENGNNRLRDALTRASDKGETLKSLMEELKLPVLDQEK